MYKEELLDHMHKWLIEDQYSHGEWGKHEIICSNDKVRTLEDSKLKPHFFSSMYAFYTLVSTGCKNTECLIKYKKWFYSLRDENGYWRSASGSEIPFGRKRGWSSVINIRHTAKGLDLLLLSNEFVSDDVEVLKHILDSQHLNGAFPQLMDGPSDLWSTAYVMNLLIRLIEDNNLRLTKPRNIKIGRWKSELSNKLNKAQAWIVSQINLEHLWQIGDKDYTWISEAVIIELGAYFSRKEPELCNEALKVLLDEKKENQATILYGALLVFNTLTNETQMQVIKRIGNLLRDPPMEYQDMIEATSLCKLAFLNTNVGVLEFYKDISGGHESCMKELKAWDESDYFVWCVQKYIVTVNNTNKTSFQIMTYVWQTIKGIIIDYKRIVEYDRGWRMLWKNKEEHQNESYIQVDFFRIAKTLCDKHGILAIREPETGRGPVDFLFSNGLNHKVLVEFKIAKNLSGNCGFLNQLIEYMHGLMVCSCFLVIFCFDEDEKIIRKINKCINEYIKEDNSFFIESIFIDARYKIGASKQ